MSSIYGLCSSSINLGDLYDIKSCLGYGADINKIQAIDTYTSLQCAIINKRYDMFIELLKLGANVNLTNKTGDTVVHTLVNCCNDVDFIKSVLSMGVNVNAQNNSGYTPLYIASYRDHVDITKILIDYGADRNIADNNGKLPIDNADSDEMIKVLTTYYPMEVKELGDEYQ